MQVNLTTMLFEEISDITLLENADKWEKDEFEKLYKIWAKALDYQIKTDYTAWLFKQKLAQSLYHYYKLCYERLYEEWS